MAKAATNTGLLSSFKNIKINDVSICTPFCGESLALTADSNSIAFILVDNKDEQVISAVMSKDHEALENLLSEKREFAPQRRFCR